MKAGFFSTKPNPFRFQPGQVVVFFDIEKENFIQINSVSVRENIQLYLKKFNLYEKIQVHLKK